MAIVIEYQADTSQALGAIRRLRRESASLGGRATQNAFTQSVQGVQREARQAQQAVRRLGTEARAVDGLTASTRRAAGAARTLAAQTGLASAAASRYATAGRGLGGQAGRLASIAQAADQVSRSLRGSFDALCDVGDKGPKATNEVTRGARGATNAVQAFRLALAGAGVLLAGRAFIGAADGLTAIQNRLRTVTNGSAELVTTQRELEAIGRRTRTELAPLAELYQKVTANSDLAVTSQRDLLNEVEGLSAALAISDVSTQAAAAAITQYTQGVGLGKFETEELKTLLEQSAPVANALSQEFRANRGQLLGMASAGELTADRVRRAIRSLSGLSDNVGALPLQVGRAFGLLRQEIGFLIGEFSQAIGAGTGLSGILVRLREGVTTLRSRMPQVIQAMTIFGTAIGAVLVTRLAILAGGLAASAVQFVALAGSATRAFAAIRGGLTILALAARRLILLAGIPIAIGAAFVTFANDAIAAFNTITNNADTVRTLLINTFQRAGVGIQLAFARLGLTIAETLAGVINRVSEFDLTGTLVAVFSNAATRIKDLFFDVGESIVEFIQGAFNNVIDIVNGLISNITGGQFGERVAESFGSAITQIQSVDVVSGFSEQFDSLRGTIQDIANIDVTGNLQTTVEELQARLANLNEVGADAAQRLGESFRRELSQTPELIDVIGERIRSVIDNNPTLKAFVDALTGNLDITPPTIDLPNPGAGTPTRPTDRSDEFDSRLDQATSALGDFNSVLQNETLGTLNTFFRSLQALTRAQETLFGAEGFFASRRQQPTVVENTAETAATDALTSAVTKGTEAQAQGTLVQRALSGITNALGITQAASAATTATSTTANTTVSATLTGAVAANTAALALNTSALAGASGGETGDTVVRAFTTGFNSGGTVGGRGRVRVPGTGNTDSILAALTPGELVVSKNTEDRRSMAYELAEEFGIRQGPQINVLDVERLADRQIRRMINSGELSQGINQRQLESGGTAVLR